MTAKQTRRLLIIAFAISLLVHAIVALRVSWPFAPPKEQVETVRIEHMHTLRVTRLPTPPPRTPPPQTPRPLPSPAPTAPRTVASATPGAGTGRLAAAGARPTPTPVTATPEASATPNCARTDTPAAIGVKPDPPEIAAAARAQATSGTTRVRVALDAAGAVQQTTVVDSSGNSSLDLVAVSAARSAKYTPALHACKAVASVYLFTVKWEPW